MAWYNGIFSCGCKGRTNVVGPTKNRKWIADRRFEKLCPECYEKYLEKEMERKNKEAVKQAKAMELPKLTGTERQVAWANILRQKLLNLFEELNEKDFDFAKRTDYDQFKKMNFGDTKIILNYILKNRTRAEYYIESRNNNTFYFIIENMKALKTDEEKFEEKMVENIKIESTVSPEYKKFNIAAQIVVKDGEIKVVFEKNDDFIKIVKSLNYKWGGVWKKKVNKFNGPIEDRAAELGNKLLNAGFPICILDREIRQKAISGTYSKEQTRWIAKRTTGDYKGYFAIGWQGRDEILYSKARSLPGSRWSNTNVVVRVEHYREVEDFAGLEGFNFSSGALKAIAEYKKETKKIKVVNPIEVAEVEHKDGLKEILNSSVDIIKDLREY